MPSFFSGKLENRTPELYMEIRNLIMNKFHANPNTRIESKDLSEISVGDLNAKQEIMEFLDYWGLINYHPFPETESSLLNIDADEAEKTDSLLEKLYQFDKEESCAQAIPKSNVATPTLASRLFPESSLADELMTAEGPSVEYHCNSCSADCSRKRYHCQKQVCCFLRVSFIDNMFFIFQVHNKFLYEYVYVCRYKYLLSSHCIVLLMCFRILAPYTYPFSGVISW